MPAPASRTTAAASSRVRPAVGTVVVALLVDLACVLVFAAIGRASHDESGGLAAVWTTAWPFLTGCALGWVASRAWRSPLAMMPTGVAVWLSTLVAGMVLRAVAGGTTAVSFVVVATVVLALFVVGWRLLVAARQRVLRT
jgi:Protein of unknown function (DUF3054)